VNRRALSTALALALAAAGLWWAQGRDRRRPPGSAGDDESEPQSVVWRMVDASKQRDVAAYLACFAGDLRTRLDATVQQLGEQGFADYLGRRVEELKGVALYDVERAGDGRAAVTVEYVFAEEKETQRLHLEQVRGRWVIADAEESRRERSLIPYGTPIRGRSRPAQPKRSATPARSSKSSASETSIRSRVRASMSRPSTIVHAPPRQVTGKE